jgi:signal transduction histidine kinase/CheY-like chemotaxis protein
MNKEKFQEKFSLLRTQITDNVLIALSVISIFTQTIATIRNITVGNTELNYYSWISVILIIGVTLYRKKLNLKFKISFLLLLSYIFMIIGILKIGLLTVGIYYILLIPALSLFILKTEQAILLIFIALFSFLLIGVLHFLNILTIGINIQEYATSLTTWFIYTLGIGLTAGILTYIFNFYNKVLLSEVIDLHSANSALEEQDLLLEKKNDEYKNLNKQLEQKNEESIKINQELKIAKEKAEDGERLKTTFLQNLSHEIRTPLNGIIGFSEFLQEENLSDSKRKEYALIISRGSQKLLRMLNDVMDISKLEAKQWDIELSEFNLNELLEQLFQSFEQSARVQDIAFKIKSGLPDNQSLIISDKEKVLQIIGNLLSNAFKFTNKGHVLFGYNLEEDFLQFYVLDTGIGIPHAQQYTIFEAFKQATPQITKEYGGNGLGLAIAKGLVELLGGKIWVESGHGSGTIFYFTIPYRPYQSQETNAKLIEDVNLKGKSILIVDDESINYAYLKTLLIKLGANIYYASNGLEALEFCKVNKYLDLVLMDIKMPVLNGIESAIQIKSFWPGLPIIAQTAYSSNEDKQKALTSGFNDFIAKPIKKQELIAKIMKFL